MNQMIAFTFTVVCLLYVSYSLFDLVYFFGHLLLRNKGSTETSQIPAVGQVTIQIPIFNTGKNIQSFLDSLVPVSRLFKIQILDSSTDDTTNLIADKIQNTTQIEHVRFTKKLGNKAWALNEGIGSIQTPYVIVLDDDMEVSIDLINALYSEIEKSASVGYVQGSWSCVNANDSAVSAINAISILAEHQIEDTFRSHFGFPFTIHGFGFIIRTELLRSLKWRDSFLSEDIDLALRIREMGFHCVYLSKFGVTGRNSPRFFDFYRQKSRWIEGRSQILKEHLFSILKSKNISMPGKVFLIHYLTYFIRYPILTLLLIFALFQTQFFSTIVVLVLLGIGTKSAMNLLIVNDIRRLAWVYSIFEPIVFLMLTLQISYYAFVGLIRKRRAW